MAARDLTDGCIVINPPLSKDRYVGRWFHNGERGDVTLKIEVTVDRWFHNGERGDVTLKIEVTVEDDEPTKTDSAD